MAGSHIPVMLKEVMEYLNPKSGGIYIDGTLGLGGHAMEILRRSHPDGRVIGIDRDADAMRTAMERMGGFGERIQFMHGNFSDMGAIASGLGIKEVDGILLDLGVSSIQIDTTSRGFSFMRDAPLDMRMDKTEKVTASDVVNTYPGDVLERFLWEFGEEGYSRNIAREIVKARNIKMIETTGELARVVEKSIPRKHWPKGIHPATKTFQALRIAVNDELRSLEEGLKAGAGLLKNGGRFCAISFHSLEDRIVKNVFRYWDACCLCPPALPVCRCGKVRVAKVLTKRAVKPAEDEIKANPRARSARLRVAEKIVQGEIKTPGLS